MDLKNFELAPFYALDEEWALLTAGVKEKFNTMTISWGGLGTIWNKPVVTGFYKEEPMHRMYIGEVVDIIDRRRNQ